MRIIFNYLTGAVLAAFIYVPAVQAADIDQDDLVAMIVACEQLEYDYAIYRDRGDAEAFANIFTEDGEWGRSTQILKGREAIADYITSLEGGEPEAHMQLSGTIQVTPVDETTATGISYAIVLEAPISESGLPATNNSFQVGSESRSVYKLTDEGWKIAQREYTTMFVDPE